MAEANWQLWEAILQELRSDMGTLKADVSAVKAQLGGIERETRGLRDMSKMALGAGTGAEFIAEQAQQAAERANKRLDEIDARLAALEDAH